MAKQQTDQDRAEELVKRLGRPQRGSGRTETESHAEAMDRQQPPGTPRAPRPSDTNLGRGSLGPRYR
jgi:hypothetical protein